VVTIPRFQPGHKIGRRYKVFKALAGGMGEVYLCLDEKWNSLYALKTFQYHHLQNEQLQEAFEKEVKTWIALEKHPNIVTCYYMEIVDKQPFAFLEWVATHTTSGTDLRSWLRHGPLDLKVAMDFAIDICRGLIHAGMKQPGIVHRDLKPENILVSQTRVAKITDFGLAKIVQEASISVGPVQTSPTGHHSLVASHSVVGTPLYMAPEQWLGDTPDPRTDIYAVGCILYEMLTGRPPFEGNTIGELRRMHLLASVPAIANNSPITKAFSTIITHCLAKQKEERFSTVSELLEQLSATYEMQFGESPRPCPSSWELTAIDHNNRGLTFFNLELYDAALTEFNKAVQLAPNFAGAYTNRGLVNDKLRRHQDALNDHNRAIGIDVGYANAWYNRGYTLGELGRCDESIRDYSQAIQIDPGNANTWFNRGNQYYSLKCYPEALTDYDRAIALDPAHAEAHHNRGYVHFDAGDNLEAVRNFSSAIRLDPTYTRAYFHRGLALGKLQRFEEALNDYTKFIDLEPLDIKGYVNRGETYMRLGRPDQAKTDFARAIQIDRACALAHRNMGMVFVDRQVWEEALPYLEEAGRLGDETGELAARQVKREIAFARFQQAGSPISMARAVGRYPFMVDSDFIESIDQFILHRVGPKDRPPFEKRLEWLQVAAHNRT
jgi:tetratricopeptide (TPR) repeat protein